MPINMIMSDGFSGSRKERLYEVLAQANLTQLESLLAELPNRFALIEALPSVVDFSTAMNVIANSPTAMNVIANSPTAMNVIANSQTALNAIQQVQSARNAFVNSTAIPSKSVPTMSSNTAPEGQCIGSSIYLASLDYFKAFDKNTSTYWMPSAGPPQWLGYVFAVPVFVHTVKLTGYSSAGSAYNPTSVKVQYSDNGISWTDVATYNQEFTSTQTTLPIPLKAGFHKYWRVYINQTNGNYPIIVELDFVGFRQM